MTQKLASDLTGHPLDFGLAVVFDGAGMHVTGRADSPGYLAVWPGVAAQNVVITDVADNYAIASAPTLAKSKDQYAVLNGADFMVVIATALGFSRADYLMKSNAVIQGFILHADTQISRTTGMTPQAISFLQALPQSPLTDAEMAAVDAVWAARA